MRFRLFCLRVCILFNCLFSAFTYANILSLAKHIYLSPSLGVYFPDSSRNFSTRLNANLDLGYQFNRLFALQVGAGWLNRGKYYSLYKLEGLLSSPRYEKTSFYLLAGGGQIRFAQHRYFIDLGLGAEYFISPRISIDLNLRLYRQLRPKKYDIAISPGIAWYFGGDGNNFSFSDASSQRTKLLPYHVDEDPVKFSRAWYQAHLIKGMPHCSVMKHKASAVCVKVEKDRARFYLKFFSAVKPQKIGLADKALLSFVRLYHQSMSQKMTISSLALEPARFYTLSSIYHAQQFKQMLVNQYGLQATNITINDFMPLGVQLSTKKTTYFTSEVPIIAQFSIVLPDAIS